MGKSHHHKAHKGRKGHGRPRPSGPPDGAVYIGLLMIGAFGVWLWTIVASDPDAWKHAVIGFVLAIAVLVNLYTWPLRFRRLSRHQCRPGLVAAHRVFLSP